MSRNEQETEVMPRTKSQPKKKKQPVWLVYSAFLVAGLILLADPFDITQLNRWTAKFGICLVWTAFALFTGGSRLAGIAATAIVWLAVLATFLIGAQPTP